MGRSCAHAKSVNASSSRHRPLERSGELARTWDCLHTNCPPRRNPFPEDSIDQTMSLSLLAPVTASFQGIAPALTPARSQAVRMQQYGGPPQQGFNVRDMPGVSVTLLDIQP